ncbi:hypothetical protein C9J85_05045 [Haloferax sp. wsp5]|nr:hypothetical protein C9J85_05045 [Haloferax sp. wsp5]
MANSTALRTSSVVSRRANPWSSRRRTNRSDEVSATRRPRGRTAVRPAPRCRMQRASIQR